MTTVVTIADMRGILGLGLSVSDEAVVEAYAAYLRTGESSAEIQAQVQPTDPFVRAIEAIYYSPFSASAIFTPFGAQPYVEPVRVIRKQPDQLTAMGDRQIVQDTNILAVRKSEVSEPRRRDTFQIGLERFAIGADPLLDVEGLEWTCGVDLIAP